MSMPTVFLLRLPLQSYCFCYLYACPLPVPDIMSSSILSMTSAASPSLMTSIAGVAMTTAPSVSPSSVASSCFASTLKHPPIAEKSLLLDRSIVTTSSQLPPAAGGGGPSGSGPGAIIGAVVAVVAVLVVAAVVVAASLIAWKVRSKGKKTLTGKQSDEVLHVLAVRCSAHMHSVLFAHTFLSIFYWFGLYVVNHDSEKKWFSSMYQLA